MQVTTYERPLGVKEVYHEIHKPDGGLSSVWSRKNVRRVMDNIDKPTDDYAPLHREKTIISETSILGGECVDCKHTKRVSMSILELYVACLMRHLTLS